LRPEILQPDQSAFNLVLVKAINQVRMENIAQECQ